VEYDKVARRDLGVCLGILVVDLGVESVVYNWGNILPQVCLGEVIHHTCVQVETTTPMDGASTPSIAAAITATLVSLTTKLTYTASFVAHVESDSI
jgi:hypothetical protein